MLHHLQEVVQPDGGRLWQAIVWTASGVVLDVVEMRDLDTLKRILASDHGNLSLSTISYARWKLQYPHGR